MPTLPSQSPGYSGQSRAEPQAKDPPVPALISPSRFPARIDRGQRNRASATVAFRLHAWANVPASARAELDSVLFRADDTFHGS